MGETERFALAMYAMMVLWIGFQLVRALRPAKVPEYMATALFALFWPVFLLWVLARKRT
jgi:hypothetical protein